MNWAKPKKNWRRRNLHKDEEGGFKGDKKGGIIRRSKRETIGLESNLDSLFSYSRHSILQLISALSQHSKVEAQRRCGDAGRCLVEHVYLNINTKTSFSLSKTMFLEWAVQDSDL